MIQNYTQSLITDATELLLEKNSIDDISVQDIVDACGTTRTTFYRYFKDKYDAMNWVYQGHVDKIIEKHVSAPSTYDMSVEILSYIQSNVKYYTSLSKYTGQNSFFNFYVNYGIDFYVQRIQNIKQIDQLDESIYTLIVGYCYGTAIISTKWIENGCKEDVKVMADMLYDLTPVKLLEYLY